MAGTPNIRLASLAGRIARRLDVFETPGQRAHVAEVAKSVEEWLCTIHSYRAELLKPGIFKGRKTIEEIAQFYADSLFSYLVQTGASTSLSKAHECFFKLCRRGLPDLLWATAIVRRDKSLCAQDVMGAETTAARLEPMRANPRAYLNNKQGRADGPPWLILPGGAVELPERMSLENLIHASPDRQRSWRDAVERMDFVSVLLNVLDNASRLYVEQAGLGAEPGGPTDDLTANSLGELKAWVKKAKELGNTRRRPWTDREILEQALVEAHVPKKLGTLDEILDSAVGRELLSQGWEISLDVLPVRDDGQATPVLDRLVAEENWDDAHTVLLDAKSLRGMLEAVQQQGVFSTIEFAFVQRIMADEGEALVKAKDFRAESRRQGFIRPDVYLEHLWGRLVAFGQKHYDLAE